MKLNQRFFGQEHFEKGTSEREFCKSLYKLKPHMTQYGFSDRDVVPPLPEDRSGLVQVKYNGMLSVSMWNEERKKFVAWGLAGRCFYSLNDNKQHPVTGYFDEHYNELRNIAFLGETYVVRLIKDKSYMTEFNKSMSIVKNPTSIGDVERIRLAIFDYATVNEIGELRLPDSPLQRFLRLRDNYNLPIGCDKGVVHLSDHVMFDDNLSSHQEEVQSFWDEFIGQRGFEGLVLCLDDGNRYKLKYRDNLDVVIIAFRISERGEKLRPVCNECGMKFDSFWLKKLVREGEITHDDWFKDNFRLKNGTGGWDMYTNELDSCPLCGGSIKRTDGPILGAKIALMTKNGEFVDIADGSQIPPSSKVLDHIEPLYEEDGYLWVKPGVVIEVSYQDLYVNRMRPLLSFEGGRYKQVGEIGAISLRPYGVTHRTDKTVNPLDLRLEQVSYFLERSMRIQKRWEKEEETRETTLDEWL